MCDIINNRKIGKRKMAHASSSEECKKRLKAARKARKNGVDKALLEKTDFARYLELKWDLEHNRLGSINKKKQFEELHKRFGNDNS